MNKFILLACFLILCDANEYFKTAFRGKTGKTTTEECLKTYSDLKIWEKGRLTFLLLESRAYDYNTGNLNAPKIHPNDLKVIVATNLYILNSMRLKLVSIHTNNQRHMGFKDLDDENYAKCESQIDNPEFSIGDSLDTASTPITILVETMNFLINGNKGPRTIDAVDKFYSYYPDSNLHCYLYRPYIVSSFDSMIYMIETEINESMKIKKLAKTLMKLASSITFAAIKSLIESTKLINLVIPGVGTATKYLLNAPFVITTILDTMKASMDESLWDVFMPTYFFRHLQNIALLNMLKLLWVEARTMADFNNVLKFHMGMMENSVDSNLYKFINDCRYPKSFYGKTSVRKYDGISDLMSLIDPRTTVKKGWEGDSSAIENLVQVMSDSDVVLEMNTE